MDEVAFSHKPILLQLLDCGVRADFEAIRGLPGSGVHREVCRLASSDLCLKHEFFVHLMPDQQIALLKAVAFFEHTVGGVGSVTLLERLVPLKGLSPNDPCRKAYAWILTNTDSYRYYSGDTKSLNGYESWPSWKFRIAQENERRDAMRQAEDRKRIAIKATGNLYNAVRRGDLKAVVALVGRGADRKCLCPDGSSIVEFARHNGRLDITAFLEEDVSA